MKNELLELYIEGQKVVLESDTKMTEKKFLWYNKQGDTFEGAGDNLQIVIPAIKENQKIFGLRNYLNSNQKKNVEFNCSLFYSGLKRCDGIFVLTKTYRDKYEGFITTNSFNQYADKLITDNVVFPMGFIDIGSNASDIIANMKSIVEGTHFASDKIQFPVISTEDSFYQGNNDFFNPFNMLNDFYDGIFYKNYWVNDDVEGEYLKRHSIMAIGYSKYLITELFKSVGWTVSGDFLTHDTLSKLQVLHNRPLDKIINIPKFKFIGSFASATAIANNGKVELIESFDYDSCFDSDYCYEVKQLGTYEIVFNSTFKVNSPANTVPDVRVTVKLAYKDTPGSSYQTVLFEPMKTTRVFHSYSAKIIVNIDRKIVNGAVDESSSMIAEKLQLTLFAAPNIGNDTLSFTVSSMDFQIRCLSHENINDYQGTIKGNDLLPRITMSDFLSGIKEFFAVEVLFDTALKNAEFKIKNNVFTNKKVFEIPLHWVVYGDYYKEFQNKILSFKFDFSASNNDLIKEINEADIVATVFDYNSLPEVQVGKLAIVSSRRVIYIGELYDISEVETSTRWTVHTYYHFVYQSDDSGTYYVMKNYTKTDDTEEIFPKAQPALMLGSSGLVIPKLDTAAESLAYQTGEVSCNLKFMFDLGYSTTYKYRVSSPMRYNNFVAIADRDLSWNSLYDKSKEYYDFIRKAQRVTIYLKLKPGEYFQLLKVLEPSVDDNHPRWIVEPTSKLHLLPIQVTTNLDNNANIVTVEMVCLQEYYV